MSLWKNHALFLSFGSIILVFSLMLYLGWLGTWSHMLDSYKVANSLYDHLVFDFWCHLMLLLMLLCRFAWLWPLLLSELVAPSLLLALGLYWVWALLVHPTPKNQVVPMCPPYIPISNLLFQSKFDLLLSTLQIKLLPVLCENWWVKLSRTGRHTLLFLILKILTLWSLMLSCYACKL
jgi:hypothetical protein